MLDKNSESNLINLVGMQKYFPIRAGLLKRQIGNVQAVDDVTLFIRRGETLGLVGESGCGKTTVGRSIMMLTTPTAGYVFFETPKDVVEDFKQLFLLRKACTKKKSFTSDQAIKMALLIDKLLTSPSCNIKEDKKKHLCADAKRFVDHVQKTGKGFLGETSILNLADEAMEEVAKKYCINFMKKKEVRRIRSRIQFVFQDPFSSLDPRMLIKDIVSEPLRSQKKYRRNKNAHEKDSDKKTDNKGGRKKKGEDIRQQTIQLLEKVGLNVEHMYRFPHEFSGGQRQRIGIARALSVRPDFIVLDEPTSALDVSVQAQILNMLNDLQKDFGLTYLFISHDLSIIRYMCDRIAVMYLGKIVEMSPKGDLFAHPTHPYTEALLSVIPVPDPDVRKNRIILTGDVPSPANPPSGCRFHTRCPLAIPICSKEEPPLTDRGNEHYVACHVRNKII